jgi:hypothetical protein
VQKCFAIIDDFYRGASQGKISSRTVARPSSDRQQQKALLRQQLQAANLEPMRLRANELYQQIIKLA